MMGTVDATAVEPTWRQTMRLNRQRRLLLLAAQHRLENSLAARMERLLLVEFNRVVMAASKAFPSWQSLIPAHRNRVVEILRSECYRNAISGAEHAQESFGKAALAIESKRGTSEQVTENISEWAKRYSATKVVIAKTTQRRIRNAVARGLAANETYRQIATRIRTEVGGMNASRAQTIARTEAGTAVSVGSHQEIEATAEELGVKYDKVWTSSADDRTRESHAEADGQRCELDEDFEVGEATMRFPRDPDGPPEEVINCRCTAIYEQR
jgi:SPP1 gp7 family putative phage head morphogenesis protein